MEYYDLSVKETFQQLGTSELGLTDSQALTRFKEHGPNELKAKSQFNIYFAFLSQFKDTLIITLFLACAVSFALGLIQARSDELIDAGVILFIVFVDAIVGFIQEFKAEKSMEALKRMVDPLARVIRQGQVREVKAADLVPGDIVLLEEGEKIPADLRLIETVELVIDSSALTGESAPETKTVEEIRRIDLPVAEMKDIAFMGTVVVRGRGKGVVVRTGMRTEFGKIFKLTASTEKSLSPLQKELLRVGKFIAANVVVICAVLLVMGLLMRYPVLQMFLLAVSVAVAAIPEGLPATVTIALAMGITRMAKKKAVIRKLNSVETLGSTTVICSDKTGTLTKNEMTVVKVFVNRTIVDVEGNGYDIAGKFVLGNASYSHHNLELLLKVGMLCNNAVHTAENKIIGDPTEGALIVSSKKYGLSHEEVKKVHPRIHEIPFDSSRKMMSTIHVFGKERYLLVKGAPDQIIERCTSMQVGRRKVLLTSGKRRELHQVNHRFAEDALRVLAFAYRKVSDKEVNAKKKRREDLEKGLIFIGMQGMRDPPRPEVASAVAMCKEAGIRIFVISGDYGTTTKAVARELGIADEGTPIMTGEMLNRMDDEELRKALEGKAVFARVNPEHKMRVVSLLKDMGEIVAVTGDGVNDAPAIKKADIGIAMGIAGTDVSKEASDMVILDDSFATIVHAVREGRSIYENITKFLKYVFTGNIGGVLTVFLGIILIAILGLPGGTFVLTATQILWINLMVEVLPALALGIEPHEDDIMKRPPRDPKKSLITKDVFLHWLPTGIIIAAGTLFVFWLYKDDLARAGTMAFCAVVLFQMANVFNCRSRTKSVFSLGFFTNPAVIGAVLVSLILQAVVVYTQFFQRIFTTVALSPVDWIILAAVSFSVIAFEEIRKANTATA